MTVERRTPPQPPIFEINISKEGWDTTAQIPIFLRELKKLKFYRKGLLYSGFNADDIGRTWEAATCGSSPGTIFCSPERYLQIEDDSSNHDNPFYFALENDRPAIAVYDPDKMELVDSSDHPSVHEYRMKDPSAIVAIIKLT